MLTVYSLNNMLGTHVNIKKHTDPRKGMLMKLKSWVADLYPVPLEQRGSKLEKSMYSVNNMLGTHVKTSKSIPTQSKEC